MRGSALLFGVRLAAVLALATSAALFADYTHAAPSFCGAGSGCQAVRVSGFGYFPIGGGLYLPTPAVGLLGFAVLLGFALTPRFMPLLPFVAGLGGLGGLGLFAIQAFTVKHFCSFCVATDLCAIVAAGLAVGLAGELRRDRKLAFQDFGLRKWTWVTLGLLAITAPLAWPSYKPAAEIPPGVLALYVPGKINVIEYADYECPVCRAYQPTLHAVVASYGDHVHFLRLNFPLPMHEFARDAARAQVCAREQGKGEPMAEALLVADDLTPEADRKLAGTLGVELGAYDACIALGLADRKIDADEKPIGDTLQGLPTTFVGAKTLIGLQTETALRDALDRAAQGNTEHGIPGPLYLLGWLALAAVLSWVGRAPRATIGHDIRPQ